MKEEIKAGIIIAASLLILSVFVILIGGGQFMDKYDRYYTRVPNAAGLEAGAQVKLGGVRVGRVMGIKPPDGPGKPVTIEIGVRQGTPLYRGTKALVTQIGFVGDIYLLLTVDQATGEKIKPGEDIPTDPVVEFAAMMAKMNMLADSVNDLIKDVNKLFSPANIQRIEKLVTDTNAAVVSGAASVEKVATGLKSAAQKLARVLDEFEDVIKSNKGEFTEVIRKAREDLEKAGEMIKSFEETSRSVGRTSDAAERAITLQSRNLDILLTTMTRTTEELQELLTELKNKPWSIIYKEQKGE